MIKGEVEQEQVNNIYQIIKTGEVEQVTKEFSAANSENKYFSFSRGRLCEMLPHWIGFLLCHFLKKNKQKHRSVSILCNHLTFISPTLCVHHMDGCIWLTVQG